MVAYWRTRSRSPGTVKANVWVSWPGRDRPTKTVPGGRSSWGSGPATPVMDSPTSAPSTERAIELIHGAGGVAIWAHPFWDIEQPEPVLAALDHFHAAGLDGVEAFYVTHGEEQTKLLAARCEELDLLTTGSSDFHGPRHHTFSRFRAFSTYGLEPRLGPIAG